MLADRGAPSLAVRWPEILQARAQDYFAMTKPGITLVVLMTTLAGFLMAAPSSVTPLDWRLLFHVLLGTAFVSAGAGTLNMLLEIEVDGAMNRTKDRPLPAGRLHPEESFFIGSFLASIGVVHIASMANLMAGFIAGMGLVLYLVFYTPMKKSSPFCTVIGAASGSLPPLIGWSALKGSVGPEGWSLFLILFVWQFPHLLSLTWLYKEDYSRAAIKMVPVSDESGAFTSGWALVLSLVLVPVSFLPFWFGIAGSLYLAGSAILGLLLASVSLRFFMLRDRFSAKILFIASILYMPLLLGVMIAGR